MLSRLRRTLLERFRRRLALERARRRMLASETVAEGDKALLRAASLRVHPRDLMYEASAATYLAVGLSAMRAIETALARRDPRTPIRAVLDFPSGHGRVLRFLRARFADARVVAAEVDAQALAFCARSFGVETFRSPADLAALSIPAPFDLVWCGSLITHLPEDRAGALLAAFRRALAPGGVCVFTTHGRRSIEWIESGTQSYRLAPPAQRRVLEGVRATGYGYADYAHTTGYGISLATPERVRAIAREAGDWTEACFVEHGWLEHQDVFAFARPPA